LNSFDAEFAMAEGHDDSFASFGGNFEFAGKRFAVDDERVVASSGNRVGQAAENCFAVVAHFAGFSVKQFFGADNFAAEGVADGLVAKADSKDGNFSGEALNEVHRNSGFLRSAGARRDHDAFGFERGDFVESDLIVAANLELATQLAEILGKVVGERIVVVEKQDHRSILRLFS